MGLHWITCWWSLFIRISISGAWSKTMARTAYFHCARAIFRSGPNIWSLEPPEGRFEAFRAPGPKPLPERLIFTARELFFGLDRISSFWSHQKAVMKHFWLLAENHCQNGLFSLRASHFSVWTEEHILALCRFSGFWRLLTTFQKWSQQRADSHV